MVEKDAWGNSVDVGLGLGDRIGGRINGSLPGSEECDIEVWIAKFIVEASQTYPGCQACEHSNTHGIDFGVFFFCLLPVGPGNGGGLISTYLTDYLSR